MFAILHYAYCNILHSCILQCFATFHIANIAKTRGACIDVMCQLHTHRWGQSYILLQGLSYLLLEVQDFMHSIAVLLSQNHCSASDCTSKTIISQYYLLCFICFLGFLPEHKCHTDLQKCSTIFARGKLKLPWHWSYSGIRPQMLAQKTADMGNFNSSARGPVVFPLLSL